MCSLLGEHSSQIHFPGKRSVRVIHSLLCKPYCFGKVCAHQLLHENVVVKGTQVCQIIRCEAHWAQFQLSNIWNGCLSIACLAGGAKTIWPYLCVLGFSSEGEGWQIHVLPVNGKTKLLMSNPIEMGGGIICVSPLPPYCQWKPALCYHDALPTFWPDRLLLCCKFSEFECSSSNSQLEEGAPVGSLLLMFIMKTKVCSSVQEEGCPLAHISKILKKWIFNQKCLNCCSARHRLILETSP